MKSHKAFKLLAGEKHFGGPERRVTVSERGRSLWPSVLRRGEVPAGARRQLGEVSYVTAHVFQPRRDGAAQPFTVEQAAGIAVRLKPSARQRRSPELRSGAI